MRKNDGEIGGRNMSDITVNLTAHEINLIFDCFHRYKSIIRRRITEEPKLSINKIISKLNICLKESGYYNEKNELRREIASECSDAIYNEICDNILMLNQFYDERKTLRDNIVKIITGEK